MDVAVVPLQNALVSLAATSPYTSTKGVVSLGIGPPLAWPLGQATDGAALLPKDPHMPATFHTGIFMQIEDAPRRQQDPVPPSESYGLKHLPEISTAIGERMARRPACSVKSIVINADTYERAASLYDLKEEWQVDDIFWSGVGIEHPPLVFQGVQSLCIFALEYVPKAQLRGTDVSPTTACTAAASLAEEQDKAAGAPTPCTSPVDADPPNSAEEAAVQAVGVETESATTSPPGVAPQDQANSEAAESRDLTAGDEPKNTFHLAACFDLGCVAWFDTLRVLKIVCNATWHELASLHSLPVCTVLELYDCRALESVTTLPPDLRTLTVRKCKQLKSLGSAWPQKLASVTLEHVPSLDVLPADTWPLSIRCVVINHPGKTLQVPEFTGVVNGLCRARKLWLGNFRGAFCVPPIPYGLEELTVVNCAKATWPQDPGAPVTKVLTLLMLDHCDQLAVNNELMRRMPALETVSMVAARVESLDFLYWLPKITHLDISNIKIGRPRGGWSPCVPATFTGFSKLQSLVYTTHEEELVQCYVQPHAPAFDSRTVISHKAVAGPADSKAPVVVLDEKKNA